MADEKVIDNQYVKEIVCPYCGWEHGNSWEMSQDGGEYECPDCGKNFYYTVNVSVTYSTEKDCGLNNEQHDWKFNGHEHTYEEGDLKGQTFKFYNCTKCEQSKAEEVKKDA